MEGLVHLWTGEMLCRQLQSWCGAPIEVLYDAAGEARVTNATETAERCTCAPCLSAYRDALEQVDDD